jgi:hypothetical protein
VDKELYLKISRPQNACVECGAALDKPGTHPSAIVSPDTMPDGDDILPVRQDYCSQCWEKLCSRDYFGFWLARREAPAAPKAQSRKERNAALLSYFDYLHQAGGAEHLPHLYFLSHLLMKYGVFRWVRSDPPGQQGGREKIVFRNTTTDDHVTVESVPLSDEVLLQIRKDLDDHLAATVSPPETGPEPKETTEETTP